MQVHNRRIFLGNLARQRGNNLASCSGPFGLGLAWSPDTKAFFQPSNLLSSYSTTWSQKPTIFGFPPSSIPNLSLATSPILGVDPHNWALSSINFQSWEIFPWKKNYVVVHKLQMRFCHYSSTDKLFKAALRLLYPPFCLAHLLPKWIWKVIVDLLVLDPLQGQIYP